ncbi:hypothetical protein DFH09DRAFT_1357782 [Mycena vulgaris]|nr:hypothetical protein DFH09DRAFT_1357782 [Mycena vulgaris]
MSTPAPSFIAYSDRPLKKKLRTELEAIASAMGLDTDQKVTVLVKSIEQYIRSNPGIADDPKFLPLFVHRTAPKATGKNSGDKATEEASEALITSKQVTGANRTLLERNVRADPPPQLSRLHLGAENVIKANDDDAKSSDSSTSDAGSRNESLSPEP